jgi:SAM-dependent methyltransferase
MTCRACARAFRGAAASPWVVVGGTTYYRCPACGHVRLEDSRVLPPAEERARYLLHHNDPEEAGYRSYLTSFVERAIVPFAAPGARVLDFGSGPVPALAMLLRERGYTVSIYDPYFAPDRRTLNGPFDLVAVHEVIEHLRRPYATLARLARRLRPHGVLAIRTRFSPGEPEAFARWWYRQDPTHVGFFEARTLTAMAACISATVLLVEAPDLAVLGLGPRGARPRVVRARGGA